MLPSRTAIWMIDIVHYIADVTFATCCLGPEPIVSFVSSCLASRVDSCEGHSQPLKLHFRCDCWEDLYEAALQCWRNAETARPPNFPPHIVLVLQIGIKRIAPGTLGDLMLPRTIAMISRLWFLSSAENIRCRIRFSFDFSAWMGGREPNLQEPIGIYNDIPIESYWYICA